MSSGTNLSSIDSNRSIAAASASSVWRWKKVPLTPSTTVSSAPPEPKAMTGRPEAIASSGTMPKSSSPGNSSARQLL